MSKTEAQTRSDLIDQHLAQAGWNVKDPAKRKSEIDKLLGDNPEQRQQFFQKYNNIKKLTETGEL